jgi:broad specificity phosphatase PhoE
MRIALLLLLLSAALAGCRALPDPAEGATFVLVRHAEKAADHPQDPGLAPAGQRRARRLASALGRHPVVAVYATPLRRAQATALPIARAHGLAVTPYDTANPADFAGRLRAMHDAGTVVVVGHSNTVPAIAQGLCDCAIGPIAETEYGRRITLHVRPDGRVTVDDRREP